MKTFTILLNGLYYALGMDLLGEHVYALEAPNHIAKVIGGVDARNRAIRSVCYGYTKFTDALHLAQRSGDYIGMLYTEG